MRVKILFFAVLLFLPSPPATAQDLLYTDAQADCAAQMIFMNECSGKDKNLLFWSKNEAFPSLGIGHFIWYPRGSSGPYRESFPGFLDFAQTLGLRLPEWLIDLPDTRAPWRTREEFEADLKSERMRELREFLKNTKREQAHYILDRFRKIFPTIMADLDGPQRLLVLAKYNLLIKRPEWTFAMIDYVNFKGEGLRSDAQYGGVGWGLAQVLLEMDTPDDPDDALDEFILAAERVLERRVSRAPRPDVEAKWLPGWKNRVRSYRTITCK